MNKRFLAKAKHIKTGEWVEVQAGCTDREYISDFETEYFEVAGNAFDIH